MKKICQKLPATLFKTSGSANNRPSDVGSLITVHISLCLADRCK